MACLFVKKALEPEETFGRNGLFAFPILSQQLCRIFLLRFFRLFANFPGLGFRRVIASFNDDFSGKSAITVS